MQKRSGEAEGPSLVRHFFKIAHSAQMPTKEAHSLLRRVSFSEGINSNEIKKRSKVRSLVVCSRIFQQLV